METPKNWLVEAILVTLFCCQPLGIVGIIFAAQVNSLVAEGKIEEAQRKSDDAGKWVKWGFGLGLTFIVLYFLFIMLAVVAGEMG